VQRCEGDSQECGGFSPSKPFWQRRRVEHSAKVRTRTILVKFAQKQLAI
jgi:hypothetical protein